MIEENLPPFSEAYSQGRLINEDDDYFADEHEDLLDLSLAFAGTFCVSGDEINCPYSIANGPCYHIIILFRHHIIIVPIPELAVYTKQEQPT